ncbi:hypothetical protein OQH60_05720 [Campylobacter sp. MIT 21-1685]|uniref:hypothetical protein n=1 Tax=unclassified Campylobacter TaxID=2593542 RepID=UPI00224AE6A9|nr:MULTISPECIES: hypothetical protein [unclassified Campylobacter]MCX2683300.1 hypothetical protein [Campylobacter sp. MIT 21-1684]MCX2807844.1 hypothetical protein [Campylobacter sp. MIT 21-1685]
MVIENFLTKCKNLTQHKLELYPYEEKECELALSQRCFHTGNYNSQELSAMWRKVFHSPNFELHHPFYTDILTRAVKSHNPGGLRIYTFFIDEQHKHPWIMLSSYDMGSFIITLEHYFMNKRYANNNEHDRWIRWVVPVDIKKMIEEGVLSKETFVFKDSPFMLDMSNQRPTHYFVDTLYYYYMLCLEDFKVKKEKLFFIPRSAKLHFCEDDCGLITIPLRCGFNQNTFEFVVKEALEEFNTLVDKEDIFDTYGVYSLDSKELLKLQQEKA